MEYEVEICSGIEDPSYPFSYYTGNEPSGCIDGNVEVRVNFPDGRSYSLTFFTIQNLKTQMQNCRETGECASGLFFRAEEMVVVETLTNEVIFKAIRDLVETNEIEIAARDISRSNNPPARPT